MPFENAKLFNRNYNLLCLCNFLFAASFNLILPVLPLYLTETLAASKTTLGLVLSLYALASLLVRPFSGWLVDSFPRKKVFLICMIPFIFCTFGYILIMNILLLAGMRFLHGMVFGAASTTISTMAVDTIPLNKLGTGIGLYGMTNSLSLAIGPMLGMLLVESFSFNTVFLFCAVIAIASMVVGLLARPPQRQIVKRDRPIQLNDFFLKSALTGFISLILTGFPYGLLINYISLHTREHGIDANPGFYFSFLALGLVISRTFSGRLMDKGYLLQIILIGKICAIAAFCTFILVTDSHLFFFSAVLMGLGYGLVSPSYQTMFIILSDEEHHGTANSTYFIAWDVSVGVSVLLGGGLADLTSLDFTYWFGTALLVLSVLFFLRVTARRYRQATQSI